MSEEELSIKEKLIPIFWLKGDRINRTDYLAVLIILFSVSLIWGLLFKFVGDVSILAIAWMVVGFPVIIIFTIMYISITVKRLHDMGASGWFALILFIGGFDNLMPVMPLITGVILIVFMLLLLLWPGTKGTNKYGEYFEIFPNPLRKIIGKQIKFFR